ncbi:S8 family serine peptidase, partial [Candidatus Omnitrophota bacterium]
VLQSEFKLWDEQSFRETLLDVYANSSFDLFAPAKEGDIALVFGIQDSSDALLAKTIHEIAHNSQLMKQRYNPVAENPVRFRSQEVRVAIAETFADLVTVALGYRLNRPGVIKEVLDKNIGFDNAYYNPAYTGMMSFNEVDLHQKIQGRIFVEAFEFAARKQLPLDYLLHGAVKILESPVFTDAVSTSAFDKDRAARQISKAMVASIEELMAMKGSGQPDREQRTEKILAAVGYQASSPISDIKLGSLVNTNIKNASSPIQQVLLTAAAVLGVAALASGIAAAANFLRSRAAGMNWRRRRLADKGRGLRRLALGLAVAGAVTLSSGLISSASDNSTPSALRLTFNPVDTQALQGMGMSRRASLIVSKEVAAKNGTYSSERWDFGRAAEVALYADIDPYFAIAHYIKEGVGHFGMYYKGPEAYNAIRSVWRPAYGEFNQDNWASLVSDPASFGGAYRDGVQLMMDSLEATDYLGLSYDIQGWQGRGIINGYINGGRGFNTKEPENTIYGAGLLEIYRQLRENNSRVIDSIVDQAGRRTWLRRIFRPSQPKIGIPETVLSSSSSPINERKFGSLVQTNGRSASSAVKVNIVDMQWNQGIEKYGVVGRKYQRLQRELKRLLPKKLEELVLGSGSGYRPGTTFKATDFTIDLGEGFVFEAFIRPDGTLTSCKIFQDGWKGSNERLMGAYIAEPAIKVRVAKESSLPLSIPDNNASRSPVERQSALPLAPAGSQGNASGNNGPLHGADSRGVGSGTNNAIPVIMPEALGSHSPIFLNSVRLEGLNTKGIIDIANSPMAMRSGPPKGRATVNSAFAGRGFANQRGNVANGLVAGAYVATEGLRAAKSHGSSHGQLRARGARETGSAQGVSSESPLRDRSVPRRRTGKPIYRLANRHVKPKINPRKVIVAALVLVTIVVSIITLVVKRPKAVVPPKAFPQEEMVLHYERSDSLELGRLLETKIIAVHAAGPSDNLTSISQRYGVPIAHIAYVNSIKDIHTLGYGQILKIPAPIKFEPMLISGKQVSVFVDKNDNYLYFSLDDTLRRMPCVTGKIENGQSNTKSGTYRFNQYTSRQDYVHGDKVVKWDDFSRYPYTDAGHWNLVYLDGQDTVRYNSGFHGASDAIGGQAIFDRSPGKKRRLSDGCIRGLEYGVYVGSAGVRRGGLLLVADSTSKTIKSRKVYSPAEIRKLRVSAAASANSALRPREVNSKKKLGASVAASASSSISRRAIVLISAFTILAATLVPLRRSQVVPSPRVIDIDTGHTQSLVIPAEIPYDLVSEAVEDIAILNAMTRTSYKNLIDEFYLFKGQTREVAQRDVRLFIIDDSPKFDSLVHNFFSFSTQEYSGSHSQKVRAAAQEFCRDTTLIEVKQIPAILGLSNQDIIESLNELKDYVLSHPEKDVILSMSWGSYVPNAEITRLLNELNDQGVILIAAAGNIADDTPSYPAALPNVISVASDDASYSHFGPDVHFVASGDLIYKGQKVQGTSFAAPRVAGAITQLAVENPDLSLEEIIRILEATANPMIEGWGYGEIQYHLARAKVITGAEVSLDPISALPRKIKIIDLDQPPLPRKIKIIDLDQPHLQGGGSANSAIRQQQRKQAAACPVYLNGWLNKRVKDGNNAVSPGVIRSRGNLHVPGSDMISHSGNPLLRILSSTTHPIHGPPDWLGALIRTLSTQTRYLPDIISAVRNKANEFINKVNRSFIQPQQPSVAGAFAAIVVIEGLARALYQGLTSLARALITTIRGINVATGASSAPNLRRLTPDEALVQPNVKGGVLACVISTLRNLSSTISLSFQKTQHSLPQHVKTAMVILGSSLLISILATFIPETAGLIPGRSFMALTAILSLPALALLVRTASLHTRSTARTKDNLGVRAVASSCLAAKNGATVAVGARNIAAPIPGATKSRSGAVIKTILIILGITGIAQAAPEGDSIIATVFATVRGIVVKNPILIVGSSFLAVIAFFSVHYFRGTLTGVRFERQLRTAFRNLFGSGPGFPGASMVIIGPSLFFGASRAQAAGQAQGAQAEGGIGIPDTIRISTELLVSLGIPSLSLHLAIPSQIFLSSLFIIIFGLYAITWKLSSKLGFVKAFRIANALVLVTLGIASVKLIPWYQQSMGLSLPLSCFIYIVFSLALSILLGFLGALIRPIKINTRSIAMAFIGLGAVAGTILAAILMTNTAFGAAWAASQASATGGLVVAAAAIAGIILWQRRNIDAANRGLGTKAPAGVKAKPVVSPLYDAGICYDDSVEEPAPAANRGLGTKAPAGVKAKPVVSPLYDAGICYDYRVEEPAPAAWSVRVPQAEVKTAPLTRVVDPAEKEAARFLDAVRAGDGTFLGDESGSASGATKSRSGAVIKTILIILGITGIAQAAPEGDSIIATVFATVRGIVVKNPILIVGSSFLAVIAFFSVHYFRGTLTGVRFERQLRTAFRNLFAGIVAIAERKAKIKRDEPIEITDRASSSIGALVASLSRRLVLPIIAGLIILAGAFNFAWASRGTSQQAALHQIGRVQIYGCQQVSEATLRRYLGAFGVREGAVYDQVALVRALDYLQTHSAKSIDSIVSEDHRLYEKDGKEYISVPVAVYEKDAVPANFKIGLAGAFQAVSDSATSVDRVSLGAMLGLDSDNLFHSLRKGWINIDATADVTNIFESGKAEIGFADPLFARRPVKFDARLSLQAKQLNAFYYRKGLLKSEWDYLLSVARPAWGAKTTLGADAISLSDSSDIITTTSPTLGVFAKQGIYYANRDLLKVFPVRGFGFGVSQELGLTTEGEYAKTSAAIYKGFDLGADFHLGLNSRAVVDFGRVPYIKGIFIGGDGYHGNIPLRGYSDPWKRDAFIPAPGKFAFKATAEAWKGLFSLKQSRFYIGVFSDLGYIGTEDDSGVLSSLGAGLRVNNIPFVHTIGVDVGYPLQNTHPQLPGTEEGGLKIHFFFGAPLALLGLASSPIKIFGREIKASTIVKFSFLTGLFLLVFFNPALAQDGSVQAVADTTAMQLGDALQKSGFSGLQLINSPNTAKAMFVIAAMIGIAFAPALLMSWKKTSDWMGVAFGKVFGSIADAVCDVLTGEKSSQSQEMTDEQRKRAERELKKLGFEASELNIRRYNRGVISRRNLTLLRNLGLPVTVKNLHLANRYAQAMRKLAVWGFAVNQKNIRLYEEGIISRSNIKILTKAGLRVTVRNLALAKQGYFRDLRHGKAKGFNRSRMEPGFTAQETISPARLGRDEGARVFDSRLGIEVSFDRKGNPIVLYWYLGGGVEIMVGKDKTFTIRLNGKQIMLKAETNYDQEGRPESITIKYAENDEMFIKQPLPLLRRPVNRGTVTTRGSTYDSFKVYEQGKLVDLYLLLERGSAKRVSDSAKIVAGEKRDEDVSVSRQQKTRQASYLLLKDREVFGILYESYSGGKARFVALANHNRARKLYEDYCKEAKDVKAQEQERDEQEGKVPFSIQGLADRLTPQQVGIRWYRFTKSMSLAPKPLAAIVILLLLAVTVLASPFAPDQQTLDVNFDGDSIIAGEPESYGVTLKVPQAQYGALRNLGNDATPQQLEGAVRDGLVNTYPGIDFSDISKYDADLDGVVTPAELAQAMGKDYWESENEKGRSAEDILAFAENDTFADKKSAGVSQEDIERSIARWAEELKGRFQAEKMTPLQIELSELRELAVLEGTANRERAAREFVMHEVARRRLELGLLKADTGLAAGIDHLTGVIHANAELERVRIKAEEIGVHPRVYLDMLAVSRNVLDYSADSTEAFVNQALAEAKAMTDSVFYLNPNSYEDENTARFSEIFLRNYLLNPGYHNPDSSISLSDTFVTRLEAAQLSYLYHEPLTKENIDSLSVDQQERLNRRMRMAVLSYMGVDRPSVEQIEELSDEQLPQDYISCMILSGVEGDSNITREDIDSLVGSSRYAKYMYAVNKLVKQDQPVDAEEIKQEVSRQGFEREYNSYRFMSRKADRLDAETMQAISLLRLKGVEYPLKSEVEREVSSGVLVDRLIAARMLKLEGRAIDDSTIAMVRYSSGFSARKSALSLYSLVGERPASIAELDSVAQSSRGKVSLDQKINAAYYLKLIGVNPSFESIDSLMQGDWKKDFEVASLLKFLGEEITAEAVVQKKASAELDRELTIFRRLKSRQLVDGAEPTTEDFHRALNGEVEDDSGQVSLDKLRIAVPLEIEISSLGGDLNTVYAELSNRLDTLALPLDSAAVLTKAAGVLDAVILNRAQQELQVPREMFRSIAMGYSQLYSLGELDTRSSGLPKHLLAQLNGGYLNSTTCNILALATLQEAASRIDAEPEDAVFYADALKQEAVSLMLERSFVRGKLEEYKGTIPEAEYLRIAHQDGSAISYTQVAERLGEHNRFFGNLKIPVEVVDSDSQATKRTFEVSSDQALSFIQEGDPLKRLEAVDAFVSELDIPLEIEENQGLPEVITWKIFRHLTDKELTLYNVRPVHNALAGELSRYFEAQSAHLLATAVLSQADGDFASFLRDNQYIDRASLEEILTDGLQQYLEAHDQEFSEDLSKVRPIKLAEPRPLRQSVRIVIPVEVEDEQITDWLTCQPQVLAERIAGYVSAKMSSVTEEIDGSALERQVKGIYEKLVEARDDIDQVDFELTLGAIYGNEEKGPYVSSRTDISGKFANGYFRAHTSPSGEGKSVTASYYNSRFSGNAQVVGTDRMDQEEAENIDYTSAYNPWNYKRTRYNIDFRANVVANGKVSVGVGNYGYIQGAEVSADNFRANMRAFGQQINVVKASGEDLRTNVGLSLPNNPTGIKGHLSLNDPLNGENGSYNLNFSRRIDLGDGNYLIPVAYGNGDMGFENVSGRAGFRSDFTIIADRQAQALDGYLDRVVAGDSAQLPAALAGYMIEAAEITADHELYPYLSARQQGLSDSLEAGSRKLLLAEGRALIAKAAKIEIDPRAFAVGNMNSDSLGEYDTSSVIPYLVIPVVIRSDQHVLSIEAIDRGLLEGTSRIQADLASPYLGLGIGKNGRLGLLVKKENPENVAYSYSMEFGNKSNLQVYGERGRRFGAATTIRDLIPGTAVKLSYDDRLEDSLPGDIGIGVYDRAGVNGISAGLLNLREGFYAKGHYGRFEAEFRYGDNGYMAGISYNIPLRNIFARRSRASRDGAQDNGSDINFEDGRVRIEEPGLSQGRDYSGSYDQSGNTELDDYALIDRQFSSEHDIRGPPLSYEHRALLAIPEIYDYVVSAQEYCQENGLDTPAAKKVLGGILAFHPLDDTQEIRQILELAADTSLRNFWNADSNFIDDGGDFERDSTGNYTGRVWDFLGHHASRIAGPGDHRWPNVPAYLQDLNQILVPLANVENLIAELWEMPTADFITEGSQIEERVNTTWSRGWNSDFFGQDGEPYPYENVWAINQALWIEGDWVYTLWHEWVEKLDIDLESGILFHLDSTFTLEVLLDITERRLALKQYSGSAELIDSVYVVGTTDFVGHPRSHILREVFAELADLIWSPEHELATIRTYNIDKNFPLEYIEELAPCPYENVEQLIEDLRITLDLRAYDAEIKEFYEFEEGTPYRGYYRVSPLLREVYSQWRQLIRSSFRDSSEIVWVNVENGDTTHTTILCPYDSVAEAGEDIDILNALTDYESGLDNFYVLEGAARRGDVNISPIKRQVYFAWKDLIRSSFRDSSEITVVGLDDGRVDTMTVEVPYDSTPEAGEDITILNALTDYESGLDNFYVLEGAARRGDVNISPIKRQVYFAWKDLIRSS